MYSQRLRDRIVFFLNFTCFFISLSVALKFSEYYKYLNAVLITTMLLHRIYEFYRFRMQFYLLDFCYIINIAVIVSTICLPGTHWLFMASYGCAMGPILLSVAIYKLSFAFHNTMRMTSLWMHLSPPIAMFIERWGDKTILKQETGLGSLAFDYYYYITLCYLTWCCFYYITLFKVSFSYIQRKKLDCLYLYTCTVPSHSKRMNSFGEKNRELGFMFLHLRFVYVTVTIGFASIVNFYYGIGLFILILLCAIWNTSTYYIDYFSVHYDQQFKKKVNNCLKSVSSADTATDSDEEEITAKPV
jgi:hypothetical protein